MSESQKEKGERQYPLNNFLFLHVKHRGGKK